MNFLLLLWLDANENSLQCFQFTFLSMDKK